MARTRRSSSTHRIAWRRIALGSLMTLAAIFVLVQFWFLCKVAWYSVYAPSSTPVMRAALAELRKTRPEAGLRYQWVAYEDISTVLKRTVVAAEDSRFLEHSGVDWDAVRGAWKHNRELAARRARAADEGGRAPGGRIRGASTITQQLAKNLFLSNDRTYVRKAQELLIAWMIEHVMDKKRILELYLNVAEWGNGVFGAQAAARHYFKVDADRLGARQSAQLAAMLPNPRFYDSNGPTRYLNSRTATLQARQRHANIP